MKFSIDKRLKKDGPNFAHLRGFHDDWAKHVISRVKLPPLPGSHETNVVTKFHENWAKNVTFRVEKCPTHWRPYINQTNVLTNFHDDWAKIVTSRENCPSSGSHETNVLTKFHENWAKNVTSRVFTCFHYIHIEKNAPPTGGHVFSPIWTIFEFVRDINKTNVLTNFHDDWANIVTSRVFTSHVIQRTGTIFKRNSHIKETNVLTKFHENWAKNVTSRRKMPRRPYINKTNVLTNFHDDWAKIVTSRVFTRKNCPPLLEAILFTCFHYIHIAKNAPPTGGHVFSPIWTILEFVRVINKTNVLTNFHDDWAKIVTSRETHVLTKFHENWVKNVTSRVFTCFHYIHIEKNAPPTGGHVFSPIWTIFELVRDINKTNVCTNFHDDWANIVTSRVFTRKTAPPTGGHVFQRTGTTFELDQHIIKANILTNVYNFHEDGTRNVASRVFTSKCLRTDGHTTDKDRSEKLT
ncbi:hypothetical protein DPMN_046708 [Dreissena polymorpha]|uniref:Uncharacterized protein n=1 Tax=Dreissena polymorpha TaxID=45954 RepID=A0A9D4DA38_DREPO|nr:hypothetical protein DPMN_046708 [Dreissena polymorpha]